MVVSSLCRASNEKFYWLDLFIRVFGDFPELWSKNLSSVKPPLRPPEFRRLGNNMATYPSAAGSFQPPRTMPPPPMPPSIPPPMPSSTLPAGLQSRLSFQPPSRSSSRSPSMLDVPDSFHNKRHRGNSAGPSATSPSRVVGSSLSSRSVATSTSATHWTGFEPSGSLPVSSGSDSFTRAIYDQPSPYRSLPHPALLTRANPGHLGSSHSLPYTPLPDSALGVHRGYVGSSHSLPNLPYDAIRQDTYTGGFNGGRSDYNPVSLRHGHGSGSGFIQHGNLYRDPRPSDRTAVQATLAKATQSTVTRCSTPHEFNSVFDNSVASKLYPPCTPTSIAAPEGTASHSNSRGLVSTSRRPFPSTSGQARSSRIKDAIIVENAKAERLSHVIDCLRMQSNHLDESMPLFLAATGFFFDGMERVMCGDYLGVPIPEGHRAALEASGDFISGLMARWVVNWKLGVEGARSPWI